jgi:hypothetical protein
LAFSFIFRGRAVVRLGLKNAGDAPAWLTDLHWIVIGYDGGFSHYLEEFYFTPGTGKNAEFEILISHVKIKKKFGVAIFYRIKDTVENREALRVGLSEFYAKRLLSLAELDGIIESLRRDINDYLIPRLR